MFSCFRVLFCCVFLLLLFPTDHRSTTLAGWRRTSFVQAGNRSGREEDEDEDEDEDEEEIGAWKWVALWGGSLPKPSRSNPRDAPLGACFALLMLSRMHCGLAPCVVGYHAWLRRVLARGSECVGSHLCWRRRAIGADSHV